MSESKPPYIPSIEAARLAPAFVCAVASRLQRLRAKVKNWVDEGVLTESQAKVLFHEITPPLPFEKELLSGKIEQVEAALTSTVVSDIAP